MTNCQAVLTQRGKAEERGKKGKSTCKQFGYEKNGKLKKKKKEKNLTIKL